MTVHSPLERPADDAAQSSFALVNAQLVLADRVVPGGVAVENGVIAAIGPEVREGLDMDGDHLIPGLIDVHTDHVEKHVIPRSSVRWDYLTALIAHDAVAVAGGITTVFDSLSVGASMKNPERREILDPLLDALEQGIAEHAFGAEHMLHMRCEICDPETIALVDRNIGRPVTRMVSVMDHTPGDRQSPDVERWTTHMARSMQISIEDGRERLAELLDRSARVGETVRAHVVAAAHAHGLPLMSHDDRTLAHVEQAMAERVHVSEFPTTIEAARHARANGLGVVAGAPNYMIGGSQSGNVAVRDLLAERLVDALASDYVPHSMLSAAFAIGADDSLPVGLPAAIGLVTHGPAAMARLADRGRLAVGLRADLVRVTRRGGQAVARSVWRQGRKLR